MQFKPLLVSFGKLLFITFMMLLLTEAGLRLLNFHFVLQQNNLNSIADDDKNKLKILALGESTTSDANAFPELAWPRQLEQRLLSDGIPARVYNLGTVATSSSRIMSDLEQEIDLYHPDIVISMMGINDNMKFFLERDSFLSHFKTYNLYKWLHRSILDRFYGAPIALADYNNTPFHSEFSESLSKNNLVNVLRTKNLDEVWPQFEKLLANYDDLHKALAIAFLGQDIRPNDNNDHAGFVRYYDILEKSLNTYYAVDSVVEGMAFTLSLLNSDRCFQFAQKYIEKYPLMSDFLYLSLEGCAKQDKPQRFERWKQVLLGNRELNGSFVMSDEGESKINYNKLYSLLNSKKIKWMAMQYPTLAVEKLKNYLTSEQQADVLFVENRQNFAEALKVHKWSEVFKDNFAYHFGHTTGYGHSLLAESAEKALLSSNWTQRLKK